MRRERGKGEEEETDPPCAVGPRNTSWRRKQQLLRRLRESSYRYSRSFEHCHKRIERRLFEISIPIRDNRIRITHPSQT